MHLMIKDIYLNLDDVLVVSAIRDAGKESAKFFIITFKTGKSSEFFYNQGYSEDVFTSNGNFHFGTDVFFYNAHKEILNKLTNAS